jgi:hypothetical protein
MLRCGERNLVGMAASLEPLAGAGVIHKDLAHEARRDAEEMISALPRELSAARSTSDTLR